MTSSAFDIGKFRRQSVLECCLRASNTRDPETFHAPRPEHKAFIEQLMRDGSIIAEMYGPTHGSDFIIYGFTDRGMSIYCPGGKLLQL